MRGVFEDISEEVEEGRTRRGTSRRVDLKCVWKTQSTSSNVKEVAWAWIGSGWRCHCEEHQAGGGRRQ